MDDSDTAYDIDIYTNLTNKKKPQSGTKACSLDNVNVGKAGYHTVELPESIYLQSGTTYSIVVTANKKSYVGIETAGSYDWISFKSKLAQKQSFYYNGSSWIDLYNQSKCARIKGLTKNSMSVNLDKTSFNYTGSKNTPAVTVNLLDKNSKTIRTLTEGEDYTVSYSNNIYPGTATVTINGTGDYAGSISKTFKIGKVTGFTYSSSTAKSIKLTWDDTQKTGYAIYRYKSGKYKKVLTVKAGAKNSAVNSGLSASTIYKYKARSFVTANGKTYYGPYTSVLKAATSPVKVTQKAASTTAKHTVTFKWNKAKGSGYELVVADNAGFNDSTSYNLASSAKSKK